MEAYASALTSTISIPIQRKTSTPAKNPGGIRESGRSLSFFLPGPKIGVLAN